VHIIILDRELYRRRRTKQQMMHDDADVTVCEGLSNSRPLAPSVDGRFLPVFVVVAVMVLLLCFTAQGHACSVQPAIVDFRGATLASVGHAVEVVDAV
jgi:hypothetical protein